MLKKLRAGLIAVAILAITPVALFAAGNWSTLPIVGNGSFCASYVSGVGGGTPNGLGGLAGITGQGQGIGVAYICGLTVPAGTPFIIGNELVPLDTGLANSAPPQTETASTYSIAGAGGTPDMNKLIGGDFSINLWQLGTTFSAITPSTAVITADRWYAYSSGNTVTISRASTVPDDGIQSEGIVSSMRVSRPSGTNTTAICESQALDQNAFAPLIGKNAVFSFWAQGSSGFNTVAGGQITATIAYYTASDATNGNTNSQTAAAGTITGYQAVVSALGPNTTGSVASGVATINIPTAVSGVQTMQRFAVSGYIPNLNASGTQVTGGVVSLCYTPASGTGASTEWFEFAGAQLEATPSVATVNLPNGVVSPSRFVRRQPGTESDLERFYSFVILDTSAAQEFGVGIGLSSTVAQALITFPRALRQNPVITVGTSASFGIATYTTGSTLTDTTCSALAAVSSSSDRTHSNLSCTTTGQTAGDEVFLVGSGTAGAAKYVRWTADP